MNAQRKKIKTGAEMFKSWTVFCIVITTNKFCVGYKSITNNIFHIRYIDYYRLNNPIYHENKPFSPFHYLPVYTLRSSSYKAWFVSVSMDEFSLLVLFDVSSWCGLLTFLRILHTVEWLECNICDAISGLYALAVWYYNHWRVVAFSFK